MFDKILKRRFYVKRHIKAPLLKERVEYIQSWIDRGKARSTITYMAQYLLRVVQFLHLNNRKKIITIDEIEKAADKWARYQSKHPQKRVAFSKDGKERFKWFALDWLKKINLRESLPEEKNEFFNNIFERYEALRHHTCAPLLNERLQYLQYWSDHGVKKGGLRGIAQYLLIVMQYLNFKKLRLVSLNEIIKASDKWAQDATINNNRKNAYSHCAKARFSRHALGWFKMFNCIKKQTKKSIPFEKYLNQYSSYMREEQGLCENTIKIKIFLIKNFLLNIYKKRKVFKNIKPVDIDDVLTKKYTDDRYSRRSVQAYASVIRPFMRYSENKKWCKQNLADSIKAPRVYRDATLPYSPDWDDVKKLLRNCKTNKPTDIRDRAILMLLSIYGIRSSEVTNLRLDDIDWKNERLYLKRAKKSKPQIFPLLKNVGDAILRYIKEVRPNNCSLREIFICRQSPYRILKAAAIYRIVSTRLKPLSSNIKHFGPHALRHACATHLINTGVSLKEISDHLGHQRLETTRIYAKVDLLSLRKVAEFKLGDVL